MYHFIVNPASKSGKGRKLWASVEKWLVEKNVEYDVYFSKKAGFVTDFVRKLTKDHKDSGSASPIKLVILGGDGTINEVLQGIADFSAVLVGYIPTGSSNDMARDIGLPCDPAVILDRILEGNCIRQMDIGEITYCDTGNKRLFAVSGGIGFDAAVCEEVLYSKLKIAFNKVGLGKLIYLAIALKQLMTARKVSANLYLDDNKEPIHYRKILFAAGMVHRFEGGGFNFCPKADYQDGMLDICVVGDLSKPLLLLSFPTALMGKHYMFKGIDGYRVKKLKIEVSNALWVHTDGEVERKSKSIEMRNTENKLQLLC